MIRQTGRTDKPQPNIDTVAVGVALYQTKLILFDERVFVSLAVRTVNYAGEQCVGSWHN